MDASEKDSERRMVTIPFSGKSNGGLKTIYVNYATEKGKDPKIIALLMLLLILEFNIINEKACILWAFSFISI